MRRPLDVLTASEADRATARELAWALRDHNPHLSMLLGPISPPRTGRALQLDARLGHLSRALCHQLPSVLVWAVDPSPALLSSALDPWRSEGLSGQLTLMQGWAHALPIDTTSIDLAVSTFPFATLDDGQLLLAARELHRVLVRDGRFALRTPDDNTHPQVILDELPQEVHAFTERLWTAAPTATPVAEALQQAGLVVELDRVGATAVLRGHRP